VPFVLNVSVPLTDADSLNVALGQFAAKGLYWLPMHSLVTFHVPAMAPPQALNDEQFGPPPLLVLPEQPADKTHARSANSFHEKCMTMPPVNPPSVHHAWARPGALSRVLRRGFPTGGQFERHAAALSRSVAKA
jgi:hypothetical protein